MNFYNPDVNEIIPKSKKLVEDYISSYKKVNSKWTEDEKEVALKTLIQGAYVQGYLRAAYDFSFGEKSNA